MGLELPCDLRALFAGRRGSVVAVGLLCVLIVGVDLLAVSGLDRAAVRDPGRGEGHVDGKLEVLHRGEHQLGLRAGEERGLGQRAHGQQRLVAVAEL